MHPQSPEAARQLLVELGAPERLVLHVELVGEAADLLLAKLAELHVPVRGDVVRVGVVVHDIGKILHPAELEGPGSSHEADGEHLLLEHGVAPEIARICRSHAQWANMSVSLEDLLVALADKLWKGVRNRELEERVIESVATVLGVDRWSMFVTLDTLFEEVAADGSVRLERSRTLP